MIQNIDKVMVVLNNFEKSDKIFEKAITIASQENSVLEIVYVHEKPLFAIPDYFRSDDSATDNMIDKQKVKKEIKMRLSKLGRTEACAILVFVDDTVDRVLTQTKGQDQTLIVTAYHDSITEKLVNNSNVSFLLIKSNKQNHKHIIMPVDLSENSLPSVLLAKTLYPQSKIRLLYDNCYVLLKKEKKKQRELFEALKKDTNLEGDYIEEQIMNEIDFVNEIYAVEKHLATHIKAHNFDLTILYSYHKDFTFSDSISFAMLEILQTDILLLRSI